ncbi:MAG: ClpXP protease specificity-enhancing factor [Legionellales bacterium]|nr:ClpXP protease specificity-enhancing factor [Legionellales bacterium]
MKSKTPYLLRAVHAWIIDNGLTPYVLVDATYEGVCVVEEHIRGGKIVLNIDAEAIDNLCLDDDSISFTAYFGASSQATQIYVPMGAIKAIFAQELGDGITFEEEAPHSLVKKLSTAAKKKILQKVAVKRSKTKDKAAKDKTVKDTAQKKANKPFLKVVK